MACLLLAPGVISCPFCSFSFFSPFTFANEGPSQRNHQPKLVLLRIYDVRGLCTEQPNQRFLFPISRTNYRHWRWDDRMGPSNKGNTSLKNMHAARNAMSPGTVHTVITLYLCMFCTERVFFTNPIHIRYILYKTSINMP
jgi:hypothetical protein